MKATEFNTIAKAPRTTSSRKLSPPQNPKASLPAIRNVLPTREKPCYPPTDPSAATRGEAG